LAKGDRFRPFLASTQDSQPDHKQVIHRIRDYSTGVDGHWLLSGSIDPILGIKDAPYYHEPGTRNRIDGVGRSTTP